MDAEFARVFDGVTIYLNRQQACQLLFAFPYVFLRFSFCARGHTADPLAAPKLALARTLVRKQPGTTSVLLRLPRFQFGHC